MWPVRRSVPATLRRWAVVTLVGALLGSLSSAGGTCRAGEFQIHPDLMQLLRWLQFRITSGQVVAHSPQFDRNTASTARGENDRQERLSVTLVGGVPSLDYSLTGPEEEASIQLREGTTLVVERRWGPKDSPRKLDFQQNLGEPLVLTVDDLPRQATLHGATLWHLWLEDPEVCREYLQPVLKALRQDWDPQQTAERIEQSLLRAGTMHRVPDRRRWAEWVAELGHAEFSRRQQADRSLRQAGPALLPFLRGLDRDSLDAEQWYRVRQILLSLRDDQSEDTPSSVVAWLVADPQAWLAFLAREDASLRSLAWQHLKELLPDERLEFDPTGEPESRQRQLARLRARFTLPNGR